MYPLFRLYRFLFADPFFRRMNAALLQCAVRGLGVLNSENDNVSGEHHLINTYLPGRITRARPVFFDVGANVGAMTAGLLARFPGAYVYAFEPHPHSFSRLKAAGFPVDRVQCNNIALGRTAGRLTLYDRGDEHGSAHASLYKEVITDIHGQNATAMEVPVETLDNVAAANKITYIDYLKIDTEGNELGVLAGAVRLLQERRIGYIHFEFNEMNVVSRVFFRDFRQMLTGYAFYRLLPRGLLPLTTTALTTEIFAYQNILAVHLDA